MRIKIPSLNIPQTVYSVAHVRIVGGSGLNGGPSLGSCPLQTDDDLELSTLVDVPGSEAVERGEGVYPVCEDQRPEGLDQVTGPVQFTAQLHGGEVVGDDLALLGLPLGEEVGVDGAPDEMVLPEVPESDLEVEDSVSHRDKSVPTEHDGGRSTGWLGELGKEDAGHHCGDDDPGNALNTHRDDREGTPPSRGSPTVP